MIEIIAPIGFGFIIGYLLCLTLYIFTNENE